MVFIIIKLYIRKVSFYLYSIYIYYYYLCCHYTFDNTIRLSFTAADILPS